MPARTPKRTPRSKKSARPTPARNVDLIEARRAVREQRAIVKLTRRARRDLATHERELRMLWMDLTRRFTGKFPDELGLRDGEPGRDRALEPADRDELHEAIAR